MRRPGPLTALRTDNVLNGKPEGGSLQSLPD